MNSYLFCTILSTPSQNIEQLLFSQVLVHPSPPNKPPLEIASSFAIPFLEPDPFKLFLFRLGTASSGIYLSSSIMRSTTESSSRAVSFSLSSLRALLNLCLALT